MNAQLWNPQQNPYDDHASLRYDDVAASGPPARPLDFPAPTVHRATFIEVSARDHQSGSIHHLKRVLVRSLQPDTAYLQTKKLAKSVYGSVRLCIVLKRIEISCIPVETNQPNQRSREDLDFDEDHLVDSDKSSQVEWESTDYLVAIKFSEWKKIHHLRGKHLEDPIKECAALQLLGNYNPHVVGALEVLQDDNCLYTVMPYLGGGDLYGRLLECVGYRSTGDVGEIGKSGFSESGARMWFRQLLQAVDHLQKKGVCHRDISLENLLLDKDDKLCLIDLGMSVRVPYNDTYGRGVTDVSAGTTRRLMITQGQGGKLMYAAPEVISQQHAVDPFATDLWSVGVVLFIMIVGLAPFKWANPSDKRFSSISKGGLKKLLEALKINISTEVCDLLQGFFWADPRKRWTLAEILQHPWVIGSEFSTGSMAQPFTFGAKELMNCKRKHLPRKNHRTMRGKNKISPEVHRNTPLLTPHRLS